MTPCLVEKGNDLCLKQVALSGCHALLGDYPALLCGLGTTKRSSLLTLMLSIVSLVCAILDTMNTSNLSQTGYILIEPVRVAGSCDGNAPGTLFADDSL